MSCWVTLGITAATDERQVRAAYAVLLKQFHPEDAPERFREIRAAYESALKAVRAQKRNSEPDEYSEAPSVVAAAYVSRPTQPTSATVFLESDDEDDEEPTTAPKEVAWCLTDSEPPEPEALRPVWLESQATDTSVDKKKSFPDPITVAVRLHPSALEKDFLRELAVHLDPHSRRNVQDLFSHPALRSLEAKELLFTSAFEECAKTSELGSKCDCVLFAKLNQAFHWTEDELLIWKRHPNRQLNAVFDLFREEERADAYRAALKAASGGLRWLVLVQLSAYALVFVLLGILSVFPRPYLE